MQQRDDEDHPQRHRDPRVSSRKAGTDDDDGSTITRSGVRRLLASTIPKAIESQLQRKVGPALQSAMRPVLSQLEELGEPREGIRRDRGGRFVGGRAAHGAREAARFDAARPREPASRGCGQAAEA